MPSLQLTQWDRYYPDIGDNRQLPEAQRVYLEVERGLSVRQREGFLRNLNEALSGDDAELVHRLAAVLSQHVRFGAEALQWEGGSVTTLEGYVRLVCFELGLQRYSTELLSLVPVANSLSGEAAGFFVRPSGTAPGTSDGLPLPTV